MRVGVSVTTSHVGVGPTEAARRVVERVRVAAAAGLDHLSVGDHHGVGPHGQYLQNVPNLGRLLAEWPVERQAGLLFLVPLWHPVLLAEQVGTLAAFSDARFIVQTGIGSGAAQFAAMGADPRHRGRLSDRAIPVVQRLLAGETVSDDGLGIADASIRPVPVQPVEWWIGSGSAPAALERAARLGDAWYASPRASRDELRRDAAAYADACARHHRTPRIVLRRDVHLGDDDATAVAVGDRVAAAGYRGIARQALVCGGVDRVADQLAALADVGVTDIAARCLDAEQADAVRTLALLGEVRQLLAG